MHRKNKSMFSGLTVISIILLGCSHKNIESSVPALYETKTQAEKAAQKFGCSGAHKMGEKWMPCEKHNQHLNNHNH